MWRNGACATISRKSAIRSPPNGFANPRSSTARSAIASCDGRTSGTLSNKSTVENSHSLRIVKDHANGMAMAGTDLADAMTQVNPIEPARPLHWSKMHGKSHGIALGERHHFGARLHPRPLLGQHEFAAGEIPARFREQDRDLQREHMFAIEILMQAIVVTGAVLQQQRRRPALAGGMAPFQERFVAVGIADIDAHGLVPAIGDVTKLGI